MKKIDKELDVGSFSLATKAEFAAAVAAATTVPKLDAALTKAGISKQTAGQKLSKANKALALLDGKA